MSILELYPDLSFEFTPAQAYDMMRLQGEANDSMSEDWRRSTNKEIAYYRAAYVEAVEALTSFGYKWWKKENPDLKDVKMELIDILHFVISGYLRDYYRSCGITRTQPSESGITQTAMRMVMVHEVTSKVKLHTNAAKNWSEVSFVELLEEFICYTIRFRKVDWPRLALLFNKLDMTTTEVYGMYVGKNVLNKFRSAYGQKEGKYNREWGLDSMSMSDNDYLIKIIEDASEKQEELSETIIWNKLEERYSKVLTEPE